MTVLGVSPRAVGEARQQGLYGDTSARLKRMLKRSVAVRGRKDVRRFMNWVLTIDEKNVVSVERID